jgi:energy-converting hydrogenase Eha subunit F
MTKTKKKLTAKKRPATELDGVYFLKIVLYVIIGAQWVHLTNHAGDSIVPLPVGLIIGVLFASHEHFQMDRKIEYALLVVAALIGFWSQAGIYVTI